MRSWMFSVVAGIFLFSSVAMALPAQAALTPGQVNAIVLLLTSFGADQATILNVWASLTGMTPVSKTASVAPAGALTFTAQALTDTSAIRQGAEDAPFVAFILSNHSSALAQVQSVTVEQTGQGSGTTFDSVQLLDGQNKPLGAAQALRDGQANIGGAFTLLPGQSVALTVAGTIAGNARSGKNVSLQVIAINASAPISGNLPIVGASRMISRAR